MVRLASSSGATTLSFVYDTSPTEGYTLSLHDALPILWERAARLGTGYPFRQAARLLSDLVGGAIDHRVVWRLLRRDRKSTRLNSSHVETSYAVFCLKKKMVAMMGVILPSRTVWLLTCF